MSQTESPASSGPAPSSLGALLDEVAELTDRDDHPSLQMVLDAFGPSGSLPVMMFVALIVVSPLSGIPFLSSISGLTIAFIALQLAVGRRSPWLPGWVRSRSISRERLSGAIARLRPLARFLDRQTRPRLGFVTAPPVSHGVLSLCAICGLAMPFMEILPFTSSLLALAVTCLGFSLLTRDGLWAVLAALPVAAAGWLLISLLS